MSRTFLPAPVPTPTLATRFWAKVLVALKDGVQDDEACWFWQGAKCGGRPGGGTPYGTVWVNSEKQKKAHVVSFFLHTGRWPEKDVCHRCDNPLCVNPAHLFEASHQANMLDYIQKYSRLGVPKTQWPAPPRPKLPFDDEAPF